MGLAAHRGHSRFLPEPPGQQASQEFTGMVCVCPEVHPPGHRALPWPQTPLLAVSLPQELSPQLQQLEPIIIHKMRGITATFLLQRYGL